jgi:hypothetical protein
MELLKSNKNREKLILLMGVVGQISWVYKNGLLKLVCEVLQRKRIPTVHYYGRSVYCNKQNQDFLHHDLIKS